MKATKKLQLILIFIFQTTLLSATITINSQAELEAAFDSTTTTIEETLILDGSTITDLSPLQNVWFIGGQFYILGTSLTSLDGLENLQFTQRIFFNNNGLLETIHLPSLNDLFFDFDVKDNASLISITGGSLPSNNSGLSIEIFNNPLLADISLLNGIQEISSVQIHNCPNIQSLDAIQDLDIAFFISLKNLHLIEHLDNFPDFSEISSIKLEDFPLVTSLGAFADIDTEELLSLTLINFPLLSSLDPFTNWTTSIRDLTLQELSLIENFEGFSGVDVTDELRILDNPMLQATNFDQLGWLRNILVSNCDTLTALNGFIGLDSVGTIGIVDCENLADLSSLNQLKRVKNSNNNALASYALCLRNLPSLAPQNFLPNLVSVDKGTLSIQNCGLDAVYGFENLEHIGVSLRIINNDQVVSIGGFDELVFAEVLNIEENNNLTSFFIPPLLGSNNDDIGVFIIENFSLTNVEGGATIKKLSLVIRHCPELLTFPILPSLEIWNAISLRNTGFSNLDFISAGNTVKNTISLHDNQFLENIDGFSSISNWDKARITFENNPLIESLTPLMGLDNHINGTIRLINNSSITSLSGLDSVKLASYIEIYDNENLQDLEGLNQLRRIRDLLKVDNNPALYDISSLSSIDSIGETQVDDSQGKSINITNNPMLSSCDVLCTIDENAYLKWGIELGGNGTYCNNMDTVLYVCENPIINNVEELETIEFTLSPNPTNDIVRLEFEKMVDGTIRVLDVTGKMMEQLSIHESYANIDMTELVGGIYFVQLIGENGVVVFSERLVKI